MYDVLLADYPRLPAETDDSARIQRAIDACENGILCIPKGDYQIASPLVIRMGNFCISFPPFNCIQLC